MIHQDLLNLSERLLEHAMGRPLSRQDAGRLHEQLEDIADRVKRLEHYGVVPAALRQPARLAEPVDACRHPAIAAPVVDLALVRGAR